MSFKEQVAADKHVFFNPTEFAEPHTWGDRQIWMVVDDDIRDVKPLQYAEGVSLYTKIVYVDLLELGYIPDQDSTVIFDGELHTIRKVSGIESDADGQLSGIITILLEANAG
ncbi:hypothetical protein J2TS6_42610 [Paenibacillus albilobatus]|uniref:Phage protein n=1 Tax=Paenibacillus albilobatus TaxID=2716884 RepID=A0A919XLR4_9BACL|nr:hypothetical protein [Paenibacillus albilobatus]GIO33120.1 hypothetical protein J2TS6_42610 [Paenibacillus albilobatus]